MQLVSMDPHLLLRMQMQYFVTTATADRDLLQQKEACLWCRTAFNTTLSLHTHQHH